MVLLKKIVVDEKNIGHVEKEALKRTSRTLSDLEVAISSWDYSPDKPEELKDKLLRYKSLHSALSRWERKMLRRSKDVDYQTRVKDLYEFVDICRIYR